MCLPVFHPADKEARKRLCFGHILLIMPKAVGSGWNYGWIHDDNDTFACPKRSNLRLNLRLTGLGASFVFSPTAFWHSKVNKVRSQLTGHFISA